MLKFFMSFRALYGSKKVHDVVAPSGGLELYLVVKFAERQQRVREGSGGSNWFGWKWPGTGMGGISIFHQIIPDLRTCIDKRLPAAETWARASSKSGLEGPEDMGYGAASMFLFQFL